jgi:hypothetical protein
MALVFSSPSTRTWITAGFPRRHGGLQRWDEPVHRGDVFAVGAHRFGHQVVTHVG